jgi:hypothetical protein
MHISSKLEQCATHSPWFHSRSMRGDENPPNQLEIMRNFQNREVIGYIPLACGDPGAFGTVLFPTFKTKDFPQMSSIRSSDWPSK